MTRETTLTMARSESAPAGSGGTEGFRGNETESNVAPDAPLVAEDPDVWHPMRCANVRDAETVQSVSSIGQRRPCPWCQLFVDLSEVDINGV